MHGILFAVSGLKYINLLWIFYRKADETLFGALIGGILGGLVLIIIILLVVIVLWKCCNMKVNTQCNVHRNIN